MQAVFSELQELEPVGIAYTSYRLEDGTFVHVAEEDSPGRLREIAAFRAFREHLDARCEEPLVRRSAERIGSYRPG